MADAGRFGALIPVLRTDRADRFADDTAADAYDAGRPPIAPWIVDVLIDRMDVVFGDRVLDVDAGTGQLTVPLAAAGLRVVALEPARPLAERLARHAAAAGADSIRLHVASFEGSGDDIGAVDAVVAASCPGPHSPPFPFQRAADVLADDGALGLVAHHPRLRDASLQWQLNGSVLAAPLEELRRDPERAMDDVAGALAVQRAELVAGGCFSEPWWSLTARRERWSRERYVAFVASIAATPEHHVIAERRLASARLPETIAVTDYVYIAVARRLPRA